MRGLDYYTGTVFEFISSGIGAQGTVCGGGRYGGLLAELGGPDMSGVGFGMGLTRLLLAMEAEGALPALDGGPQVYLAPIGSDERGRAFALAAELRAQGVTDGGWDFLEPHAYAVMRRIQNPEIAALHIMEV